MTLWRWCVSLTLLAGIVFLAGIPSSAQDKDKASDKAAVKDKTEAPKDKVESPKDKKDDAPKDKVEAPKDKKDDAPKDKKADDGPKKTAEEPKGVPAEFKAFDPKSGSFYQTVTTKTEQSLKVQGQGVDQKQDQTFVLKWTPKEKSGEDYVVQQEIVAVIMNIDIAGNKVTYDSKAGNQPKNPMTEFFQALVGSTLTLTVDKDLNVKKVEGAEKLIEKLSQGNKQLEPLLKSILSEDALKQMAIPSWGAYPTSGKKNWDRTSDLKLAGIGTYKTTYNYTQDSDEKVKIDAKLVYSAPSGDNRGTLPFTIKDGSSLTTKKATGTATIDKAKGRIASSTMTLELEGTLKIDVAGMDTDVVLTQSQTTTVESSDTAPSGAAPATKDAKDSKDKK